MSKIEHLSTDDTMTSEEDIHLHYHPSFETVLREPGTRGGGGGEDDSHSHCDSTTVLTAPPPPPAATTLSIESILHDLRNTVLFSPRQKKTTTVPDGPMDRIAIHDDGGDEESTIEVEAGVPMTPRRCQKPSSRDRKHRRRRGGGLVCGSCVIMLFLIVVVILGLTLGLLSRDNDSRRTAGSSDKLVGGDEDTLPPMAGTEMPTPKMTTVPTSMSPPTSAPAEAATEPPTALATPLECVTVVEATETCHAPFSGISIYFRNCEPQSGDWIGLWSVSSMEDDERGLPEPIQWLYQCGSQDCQQVLDEDVLFFGAGLPPDTYVALFVRFVETTAPYTSTFFMSDEFQVASTCGNE